MTEDRQRRPAWRRRTRGERRWPSALGVVAAIVLQLVAPEPTVPQARYLLVALEILLLGGMLLANPFRMDRESVLLRGAGLGVTGLVGLSNGWSAVLLVTFLVENRPSSPGELLFAGGTIWVTNVLAFALAYWELDRGGPAARAAGTHANPDFLFPQLQSRELAGDDWEPQFADYLYLSFTNCTAFSPTDVLPLSRWAKVIMMVQAVIALVVVLLVVARAVNVLGGSGR
ncbi:MAG: hypothetical protein ACJ73E_06725 [Mycobacteriales bacterium]